MSLCTFGCLLLALLFVPQGGKAELSGQIYKNAKVGDWISFKVTGSPSPVETKQSVIVRTEQYVIIKIEQKVGGRDGPPSEYAARIDEDTAMTARMNRNPDYLVATKKKGSGKETLTIGDRTYDCVWQETESTALMRNPTTGEVTVSVSVSKTWHCPDVPLGGVVRSETETNGRKVVTEITGFGKG